MASICTRPLRQLARRWSARLAGSSRAFTLVELLVVVAMIGVLAAIAVVGYRRYLISAKGAEAKEIIGQIHVAEASYRAETLGYLGCSDSYTAEWYPGDPDGKKRSWVNPAHGDIACWRMLNVTQDGPTYFGFTVVAGKAGVTPAKVSTLRETVNWPAATEPWYIVQAAGDNDSDGTMSYFVSSSFAPNQIIVQDETE